MPSIISPHEAVCPHSNSSIVVKTLEEPAPLRAPAVFSDCGGYALATILGLLRLLTECSIFLPYLHRTFAATTIAARGQVNRIGMNISVRAGRFIDLISRRA